jgi:multidrug efflux system membrane fusion protein
MPMKEPSPARCKGLAGGARPAVERIPVQMGTSATSDTPYAGQLQLIDNQVDPRSGTVRVRAVFDNKDGRLMPGQFARIRMGQPQTARTLLVSERAVGTDQDKKYVLVVGEGRQDRVPRSHAGRASRWPAHRAQRPEVRRAHRRQRPAARAPGRLVQPQAVPMNNARSARRIAPRWPGPEIRP